MRFALAVAVLGAAFVLGCSGGGTGERAVTTPAGVATTLASGLSGQLTLEPAFGRRAFDRPTEVGVYDDRRFFIAEQAGLVSLALADGSPEGTLLDIRGKVLRQYGEQGFLSLALDPAFPTRPYIYTYYSASGPDRTVLSRFEVHDDQADTASELVIKEFAQPHTNHKGGSIRFGPDGMLYLGLGDGGGYLDPNDNSQNLGRVLGKILRIDVRNASPSQPYVVPSDNPFVERTGALPEVWAYGFRNPWRMSFDTATGKLWVGDVGENTNEEVDVVERGGNYGWDRIEGNDCVPASANCDRSGTIAPLASYSHADGCAVAGRPVYRGSAVPQLKGMFLYGDYCSGDIWALPVGGGPPTLVSPGNAGRRIASSAVDQAGEVYVVIHGSAIMRITGLR